jgi:hypothetical protein
MGRKAEKTRFVDRYVTLNIRMKGRQKNEIIEYARKKDLSVTDVVLYAVWEFIRNDKGIPSAGSAQFSLPTVDETVLAYIRGEHILQPCGKRECDKKITEINQMQFCETCNIRIM